MGGDSKSSQDQESTQTTTTPSVDGVGISDIFQGENVEVTQNFPSGVQEVVSQLIDLSDRSIRTAAGAGQKASQFADDALQQVSRRLERQENPELSIVRDVLPIGIVLSLGVGLFLVFRR